MRVRAIYNPVAASIGKEDCVSLTPLKRHGRTYQMGTVFLDTARFLNQFITGEVVVEFTEQNTPSRAVLSKMVPIAYDWELNRWFTRAGDDNDVIDVTDGQFNAAVIVGSSLYISKDYI